MVSVFSIRFVLMLITTQGDRGARDSRTPEERESRERGQGEKRGALFLLVSDCKKVPEIFV